MTKNKNLVYTLLAFAAGLGVWLYTRDRAESPAPTPAPVEASALTAPTVALPISVRELLSNMTEAGDALPAQTGNFKGIQYGGQEPALAMSRTGKTVNLSIGEKSVNVERIFRFKNDPESLVIGFADDQFVYLKFRADVQLRSYPQSLKTWTGWSVSKKGGGIPVVLIEDIQKNWPRAESLREITPSPLPH